MTPRPCRPRTPRKTWEQFDEQAFYTVDCFEGTFTCRAAGDLGRIEGYAGQQFVGIDLHRRRSVLVRMTADGEVFERVRIINDIERLAAVIARAGKRRR